MPDWKRRLSENWREGAIGAGAALALGLIFWIWQQALPPGYLTPAARWSYDLPFILRPPARMEGIVIIEIDEVSVRQLNQSWGQMWSRQLHAQLLKRLKEDGAKLVVFDIVFADAGPPEADRQLAAAIKENGRVILASELAPISTAGLVGEEPVKPRPEFLAGAAGSGLVNVDPDSDHGIRLMHPGTEFDPALPWAAAAAIGAPATRNPAARFTERWINYYGPYGTIPRVSYALVSDQAKDFFRDKVVFVGGKPRTRYQGEEVDEFFAPWTRFGDGFWGGVQVLATCYLNLAEGNWLTRPRPWVELLLFLVAGLVFGLTFCLVRPLPALGIAAVCSLGIALAAWSLMWSKLVWFSWAVICGVQMPAALAGAVLAHTRRLAREKKQLEESLSKFQAGAVPFQPQVDESEKPTTLDPISHPSTAAGAPEGAEISRGTGRTAVVESGPPLARQEGLSPPPIPNHRLLRLVGKGAYGEVWLARDDLGLYHAVKVIYRSRFNSADPFEREFRGLQKFTPISRNHAGLVHILHVGRNDPEGYFFYIMEAGDGQDGRTIIDPTTYMPKSLSGELRARRKLPVSECLQLSLHLTAALDYLHRQLLVHRDIKPSNIIFVGGLPKFADIGLVAEIEHEDREPTYIGTEGYIAPEGPGKPPADIFSLGKVIYEACMGLDRKVFPTLPDTLVERPDSKELMQLNDILLKACAQSVSRRYTTAAAMHADLLRLHAATQTAPAAPPRTN
jgi:CHASE2 domain-containing sensor protein